jgi:4-amino-4-deoxy-L-arabinose transferase-like glycosyltransferase
VDVKISIGISSVAPWQVTARRGWARYSGRVWITAALVLTIVLLALLLRRRFGWSPLFTLIPFVVAHYVAVLLFCGLAYIVGRRLTRRMAYASLWEQLACCTTLGLGVLALVVLAVGLFGDLYPQVLLTIGLMMLLACWRSILELVGSVKAVGARPPHLRIEVFALAALVLSPILFLPLYPPTDFDAIHYHLVYAKLYAAAHQLVYEPLLRTPVFPQMVEMLYTAMIILLDDIGAQLVHFAAVGLILAFVYSWGKQLSSARVGIWGALLCMASPLLLWEGGSAYIDAGFALFTTAALYAASRWLIDSHLSWLILSGAFGSFAAGTKYTGCITILLVGLIVLYKGVRARDLRPTLIFGLVAALGLSPFYVRNFYYTGNPVWPFLGPIFGFGTWSPADYQANLSSLGHYGVGTDLVALLTVPWNLVFNASKFGGPALITPIHLLLGLTLPFGFKNRSDYLLGFLLIIPIVFWFFSAQDARYLLPIFPLGCVVLARSMDRSMSSVPSSGGRVASIIAYCLLSVAVLRFGVGFAASKINGYGLPPVTSTQRQEYLSLRLPGYSAVRWLNENVGAYRAYRLFGENLNYYFDGPVIGDHFGLARYSDITSAMINGELLYARLKTFGITHLFVLTRPDLKLPDDSAFNSRFRQIYTEQDVLIYELVDADVIR